MVPFSTVTKLHNQSGKHALASKIKTAEIKSRGRTPELQQIPVSATLNVNNVEIVQKAMYMWLELEVVAPGCRPHMLTRSTINPDEVVDRVCEL